MKLEKIGIRNFRTLENIEISFDGYFSSISGRNNAGKTSIIKAIEALLKDKSGRDYFYFYGNDEISYDNSKTQWVKGDIEIEFKYTISVTKDYDPGLHGFIKKIAVMEELDDEIKMDLELIIKNKNEKEFKVTINDKNLGKFESNEIFQRISSSHTLCLHNASGDDSKAYPFPGRGFYDMILSKNEKNDIKQEQARIQKTVAKFAKNHKDELHHVLGKLQEKYEVELSVFDNSFRNSVPLSISLKDKDLKVGLGDWGAGTRNRTNILMLILSADKIKKQGNDENRATPIIIIEEPENFLHPSAQAEFGRVIRELARDLKIQIIVTTHSPFMLCQQNPESNILLNRKLKSNKLRETFIVDVSKDDDWVKPFSEVLGLNDDSITPWRDVIGSSNDNEILVEGPIDKQYLEYISSLELKGYILPKNVQISAYGGKDSLKNTAMLSFGIKKFKRVFVTFDLDAKNEVVKSLQSIGLSEDKDYMAIGKPEDGRDRIEGLLPERIKSKVYSENPALVDKLCSSNTEARKSAKNHLKTKLLAEFKISTISTADLEGFKEVFIKISKAFSK